MPAWPSFARFVALDWSGARAGHAQRRALARCVVARESRHRRVVCLATGWDRRETVDWLAACAADGVPTLVGLDFPFAYAAPFLDHLGARDFSALLACMAPLDGPPGPLEAFVARCGRWWGRWGRKGARWTRRTVERLAATRGAESPLRALPRGGAYHFVGPRQVGRAAITGLAAIAALRAQAPGVRVWPFEDPAGASLVLAEIWPRLALGPVVKSDPAARLRRVRAIASGGTRLGPEHRRLAAASDHAIDALTAAVEMASGRWRLLGRSALPPAAAREGWILGVASPGHRAS